jgi:hypothetical protein
MVERGALAPGTEMVRISSPVGAQEQPRGNTCVHLCVFVVTFRFPARRTEVRRYGLAEAWLVYTNQDMWFFYEGRKNPKI